MLCTDRTQCSDQSGTMVRSSAAKSDAAAITSMPSDRDMDAQLGCHRAIDQSGFATRSTIWCTTESPVQERCSRVGQST